jgi:predicted deacetylase
MAARLVVSLSGITDEDLPECVSLSRALRRRNVPLSLLVPTRRAAHEDAVEAARAGSLAWHWIRRCALDRPGVVVLHGVDPRRLGRHAEYAALHRHEARLRLIAATRELSAFGLSSGSFCPPRWASSTGTRLALRELGFEVCADLAGVHHVTSGEFLRGRVLTPGQGPVGWNRAVVGGAGRVARRGGLVQLTVRGGDLRQPRVVGTVLAAVDTALAHGAEGLTYPELTTTERRLAASA